VFSGINEKGDSALNESAKSVLLGFLRPEKYGHYERERRWLVERLPNLSPLRVYDITDCYIEQSRLRLRYMKGHGVADEMKLTKKGELSADTRIITTIYLDPAEFTLLSKLPGRKITKRRYYFAGNPEIAVDVFEENHAGLIMAEVEFPTMKRLNSYQPPDWIGEEVTNNKAYSGGNLS